MMQLCCKNADFKKDFDRVLFLIVGAATNIFVKEVR